MFSCFSFSELVISYARHLEKRHDMLLDMLFDQGTYKKLYSYRHLINGFAVHISPEQVKSSSYTFPFLLCFRSIESISGQSSSTCFSYTVNILVGRNTWTNT